MALKLSAPIPLFTPPPPLPRRGVASTELRFSRWNNANAEPFQRRRREQHEIEADIRLHRRNRSISNLADDLDTPSSAPPSPPPSFRSSGSPSLPSLPSIPGKKSKYSKPPDRHVSRRSPRQHPAFRRPLKQKITTVSEDETARMGISVGDNGIAYRIEGAPFEFQYSYTETPKAKPVALREPPFLPFGPETMPRPWTGRAPLPASKKNLPEFDSFKLPPAGKKGVKPVQAPGPFLAGSGPKYRANTRDEILGEPLTVEEVKELVKGSIRMKRQLNMGRDGLTHNMLDNIHAHWKRKRVCKIKCKGVCTVDMDNVRQQLEEKTGGKIIYNRGGVIFLYRGRNYNYKTRPRFPLMLWKPVTPVYPRLVQKVPEGLTVEEVSELRKKGCQLPPICKLGKNGVYSDIVQQVKEAFEACELVRINCKGLNKSDCRKIGAKLKDLVPCVLISFEFEHILVWRGKEWKYSLPPQEDDEDKAVEYVPDTSKDHLPNKTDAVLNYEESQEPGYLRSSSDDKPATSIKNTTILEIVDVPEEDVNSETPESGLPKTEKEQFSPNTFTENIMVVKVASGEGNVPIPAFNQLKLENDAASLSISNSEKSIPAVGKSTMEGSVSEELKDSSHPENEQSSPSSCTRIGGAAVGSSLRGSSNIDVESCLYKPSSGLLLSSDSSDKSKTFCFKKMDPVSSSFTTVSCDVYTAVSSSDYTSAMDFEIPREVSNCQNPLNSSRACMAGIVLLLRQAVEDGSAVVLGDEEFMDANIAFKRSVALAKTAPPGPIFRHKVRKVAVKSIEKAKSEDLKDSEHRPNLDMEMVGISNISEKRPQAKRKAKGRKKEDFKESFSDIVPHGSLKVDELAKLLG